MRRIVCISGTSRPDNNTAKALAVVRSALEERGVVPTVFDARELELPFPGKGSTPDAEALRVAVTAADGIVLATPEYHGCFSAMTKLIIENLGFPSVLAGKPVALVGVAAGRIGAIKSLEQLRGVCSHVGALVLPAAISIAGVHSVFDEEGNCVDAQAAEALSGVATGLLDFIEHYVCPRHILESMARSEEKPWTTAV